jgi:putative alpha-1,2-mannosidase
MALRFDLDGQPLLVRVGLSTTGIDGALSALRETQGSSFNQVARSAESLWERELEKIRIDTSDLAMATR